MNRYQDIDDGLNEFKENQERAQAEEKFKGMPDLFNGTYDDHVFRARWVDQLILTGHRVSEREHPFSYESGYATVEGYAHFTHCTEEFECALTVRWSDGGKFVEADLHRT